MRQTVRLPWLGLLGRYFVFAILVATATVSRSAVLISEPFINSTTTGTWVYGGTNFTACLTAGGGTHACATNGGNPAADGAGNGWLRLTNLTLNAEGYAYYSSSFASAQGFVVDFDFASWGGTGADGLLLFLADSSKTFSAGDVGGSFSYANGCNGTAGMNGGWLGIAFDEWGNFSSSTDRCKNGGPGQTPESVALRGPASGPYTYITGDQGTIALNCPANNPGQGGPTPDLCTTRPATTSVDFRHARVSIIYGSTGTCGSSGTWSVYIDVQYGSGASYTRLVPCQTGLSTPPTNLRIGFAASTGSYTDYHEIRNLLVTNPVDTSVTKTVSASSVGAANTFTYTLAVANSNLTASTSTVVKDTMPTTLVVPSTTSPLSYSVTGSLLTSNAGGATTCTYSAPTITCTVGTLPAGGSGNIVITAKSTAAGSNTGSTATNTAVVSQADLDINQNNNTSSVSSTVYAAPSLTAVKSANSCTTGCTVNPNGSLLYTIQVTDSGGPSTTNVMTDSMSLHTALQLNYGGTGNPFTFSAGSTGLTMGTPVYSKDNGTTWTYTLVSGAGGAPTGYDGLVTNFRIPLTGSMTGGGTTYSVTYNTSVFK